ncbi:MAG: thiazole synthase, partial [Candidatus Dormibacteraceae bacterium]
AQAERPTLMAEAICGGVIAGRKSFLAGRIAKRTTAIASSPTIGVSKNTS